VVHALIIAAGMAVAFTVLLLLFVEPLYRLLRGEGQALANALAYSNIIFAGVWCHALESRQSREIRSTDRARAGRACLWIGPLE
jgi:Na+-driven multidrug efflux pump